MGEAKLAERVTRRSITFLYFGRVVVGYIHMQCDENIITLINYLVVSEKRGLFDNFFV